jgi:hypothetical protein
MDVLGELDNMDQAARVVGDLRRALRRRAMTDVDKAAAAHLMASIYTGTERILEDLLRRYGMTPPTGEHWHAKLMGLFCEPATPPLPVLFETDLAKDLRGLRSLRHRVRYTYAFDLNADILREAMQRMPAVVAGVRATVEAHLDASA